MDAIVALVFAVLALMAFSLILFDRFDPVYLYIGFAFLVSAGDYSLIPIGNWTELMSAPTNVLLDALSGPLSAALWIIVWWVWFGRSAGRWIPWVVGGSAALRIVCLILGEEIFIGVISHQAALGFFAVIRLFPMLNLGLVLWIVVDGIRRRGMDGWLVLPTVLLRAVDSFWNYLAPLHIPLQWFPFGIKLQLIDISLLLNAAVIALLLLRRLLQSMKRQRQMAADVRSAQEVQQVILPESRVMLPGLEIESEYRPAREVGGDFFQIIPDESDGGLLIVAGDVAGKGLRAGMLVALLVAQPALV